MGLGFRVLGFLWFLDVETPLWRRLGFRGEDEGRGRFIV